MTMSVAALSTTVQTSSITTDASGLSHRISTTQATVQTTSTTTSGPKSTDGVTLSAEETKELRRAFQKKYRHVAAIHSKSQPSTLSHDAASAPSFLGFRNLMVIVLGTPRSRSFPAQVC
jgi:diacylglycerol O-acyltransferase 1